jgi:hypothetical protein
MVPPAFRPRRMRSLSGHATVRPFRLASTLLCIAALCGDLGAATPKWPTIPPEELAATKSEIEPEAAAEIMLMRVDRDDTKFPEQTKIVTYRRYKIYAPEGASELTRVVEGNNTSTVARLTQSDGSQTEFGKADFEEQPAIARGDGQTLAKVWLLAIKGVQPGSVLEYVSETEPRMPRRGTHSETLRIQQHDLPVRRFEWTCRFVKGNHTFRLFAVNAPDAELKEDTKKGTMSVVATRLPALKTEPHVGPSTDYSATLILAYTPKTFEILGGSKAKTGKIDVTAGPWAFLATIFDAWGESRATPTKRITKLAAELTASAKTQREKARIIHRHVQSLYRDFLAGPYFRPKPEGLVGTPDHVLDFAESSGPIIEDRDFFWLALALYRAAGLEAHAVLLPDRGFARFEREQVSAVFMRFFAAAIQVDGKWAFSYPLRRQNINLTGMRFVMPRNEEERVFYPFGMLPWHLEGQVGLLAQNNKEEFVEVPFTPAANTKQENGGIFALDEAGTLTGRAFQRYTGHSATSLRGRLLVAVNDGQKRIAQEEVEATLPGATVTITKIEGVTDPEDPLEIHYELNWPGFAAVLPDRLVLAPSVFRRGSRPQFPSATRRHPVYFRTPRQEADRVAIRLPAGYVPETTQVPLMQSGKSLLYRLRYGFDGHRRLFTADRDFSSELIDVSVSQYPPLKAWYDALYASDQHELVFVKTTAVNTTP